METILYEGKCEFADYIKITYTITDGVFEMTQYKASKADKNSLLNQTDNDNEISLTIDKYYTKRLFETINEQELQEKFSNPDGFIDFQDFCAKKKIEMHFKATNY